MPTPEEISEATLALEEKKFGLAQKQFDYQQAHDQAVLHADKIKSYVPIAISLAVLAVSIVQVTYTVTKNSVDAELARDATDLQIAKLFIEDAPTLVKSDENGAVALRVAAIIPTKYGKILDELVRKHVPLSEYVKEMSVIQSELFQKGRVFIHYNVTPEPIVEALVANLRTHGYAVYPSKDNDGTVSERLQYFTMDNATAKALGKEITSVTHAELPVEYSPVKNSPDIFGVWLK